MSLAPLLPESTVLVMIDIQERLAPAMDVASFARVVANGALLLDTAKTLDVPVLATEQYPKGLGHTISDFASRLLERGVAPIEKVAFDACAEPAFARALEAANPKAAVLFGMETHVCIFQTARSLAAKGIATYVVSDAVASRRDAHRLQGLSLCEHAGAVAIPAESVVFDWMKIAGTEAFRTISKMVRNVP